MSEPDIVLTGELHTTDLLDDLFAGGIDELAVEEDRFMLFGKVIRTEQMPLEVTCKTMETKHE